MRWALTLAIATSSLIIGYDHFQGAAFAVMGGPQASVGPQAPTSAPPDVERAVVRLDLPVAWQLTRSKLLGPGATTLTESFRETWSIEISTTGRLFLLSPRARVPAYVAGPEAAPKSATDVPRQVVLSERDLARLVGISPALETPEDETEQQVEPVGRPVTLSLLASGKSALDVSLTWTDDEHYAIHLDIGGVTTL